MSEKSSFFFTIDSEHFNRILAVCIAVVTLFASVLAYAQSDAAARDDRANRDSKRYSIEAFGRQASGDARVNFDYNIYKMLYQLETQSTSAANRDDTLGAKRYSTMAGEITRLTPLLMPPYYDAKKQEADVARYEADTYLVEITTLKEKFLAASDVKQTWDSKANAYIINITLLAVALFFFGLATTISGPATRWIFAFSGLAITVIAVASAISIYTSPVFDLRQQGSAIDDYAKGVGMAHQKRYDEAVAFYDKAIQAYPKYANAYRERADVYWSLNNYEKAAADFEMARAEGNNTTEVTGNLAWCYYNLGRFADAITMSDSAIAMSPDVTWLHFDKALTLLAMGKVEEARQEYNATIDSSVKLVSDAKAVGQEPPSYVWWGLQDAADTVTMLVDQIENPDGKLPANKVTDPEPVKKEGTQLITLLKDSAVSLEYTGKKPEGSLTATIGAFKFAEPLYDEEGNTTGYNEPTTEFPAGLKKFSVLFDYENMKDGSDIVFKLYIDGTEDPSWRIVSKWSEGKEGTAEIPISFEYSDVFTFDPGEYTVELYVDWHLAQSGSFQVKE